MDGARVALLAALVLTLTYVPAMASLLLREVDVPTKDPLLVRALNFVYPKTLAKRCRELADLGVAV